jgi:hypothetical protein
MSCAVSAGRGGGGDGQSPGAGQPDLLPPNRGNVWGEGSHSLLLPPTSLLPPSSLPPPSLPPTSPPTFSLSAAPCYPLLPSPPSSLSSLGRTCCCSATERLVGGRCGSTNARAHRFVARLFLPLTRSKRGRAPARSEPSAGSCPQVDVLLGNPEKALRVLKWNPTKTPFKKVSRAPRREGGREGGR